MPEVRPRTLPFLVLLLLLLGACSDSTGPGTTPEPRLRITPGEASLVTAWHTLQLNVEVIEVDGDTVPLTGAVAWSSSAPERVAVDAAGVVRRTGLGTATITATSGELSGSTTVSAEPLVQVTAGSLHACGLTEQGAAYCWGSGDGGELGNGTLGDSEMPVPVSGGHRFTTIDAGNWFTCGLTAGGETYCWGENGARRQQGLAPEEVFQTVPTLVPGELAFVTIDTGDLHACGLTADQTAYCWGQNGFGALGNGVDTEPSETPIPVSGGLRFREVGAGGYHTCGITVEGETYCWGHNVSAQLGIGTSDSLDLNHPTPMPVAGGLRFESLAVGSYASCGLDAAGGAYCWGWDLFGQIGDGPASDLCRIRESENPCRKMPSPVAGGRTWSALTGGNFHACGLTTAGEAFCWGSNGSGRLGNDGESTDAPVAIAGHTFQSLSAGGILTCGIETSGALYCSNLDGVSAAGQTTGLVPRTAPGMALGTSLPYPAARQMR